MADKLFAQKAYEKMMMVKRNPDQVTVMLAQDDNGDPCLVLMVGSTPIATILREPNGLDPDFESSKIIQRIFDEASLVDSRKTPEDFDDDHMLVTGIIDSDEFPESFGFSYRG